MAGEFDVASSLDPSQFDMAAPAPSAASGAGDSKSPISMDDIMASFSKVSQSIDASMADLNKSYATAQTNAAAGQDAEIAKAKAQGEVNLITAREQMAVTAANRKSAADFATNPDAPNFILASLGSSILEKKKDLDQRDKMIQGKMDQSFFDDPLSFIANQFTMPLDIAAYNNELHSLDQDYDTLTKLTTATQEAYKVNAGIAEVTSVQKVAALNAVELANATINVAKSKMEIDKLGIGVINARIATSQDQLSNMLRVASTYDDQQRIILARSQQELERRKYDLQNQYKEWELGDRKDKQKLDADQQVRLTAATKALGMADINIKEFRIMPDSPLKRSLTTVMLQPELDAGVIGKNAAAIADTYNTLPVQLPSAVQEIRKKLADIKTAAMADPQWTQYKPEEQNAKYQKLIDDMLDKQSKNIPDSGSMYSPAPLASVLNIPAVSKLSIAQVLKPLAESNPEYQTSANTVFVTALNKILKGEATPEQMANEVSTMYTAINVDNIANRQYSRFALPIPKKFVTSINTTGGFGGGRPVDMTNKSQLISLFTREVISVNNMTQQSGAQSGQEVSPTPTGKPAKAPSNAFGIPAAPAGNE